MQTVIAYIRVEGEAFVRTYTESNTVSETSTGTAVDVTPLAGVETVVDRYHVSVVVVLATNVWK